MAPNMSIGVSKTLSWIGEKEVIRILIFCHEPISKSDWDFKQIFCISSFLSTTWKN